MSQKQQHQTRGPLVEDATTVGGLDRETGAPVIRPKTPDHRADESMTPTDPRERSKEKYKKHGK